MLKALLKKQMLEFASVWLKDKKTGKMRTGKSLVGFIVLFLVLFGCIGMAFVSVGMMLAQTFLPAGLDWLYFALMGMLALLLGVFGDVFNSYASLYLAKDNELLLSLPVKPSYILFVRMISVYLMGFIYEAIAFIPSVIVYWINAELTVPRVLFPIILLFVIGIAVLVLTCVLGYFVALISTRIKGKSFVTVICTLVFLGAYYFFYFKLSSFLQTVAIDPAGFGSKVKGYAYPAYVFGLAGAGDVKSLLLVIAVVGAACALTYLVLSKTFTGLATRKRGEKKTVYKEKNAKASGVSAALLKRELKHFVASPSYMLNSGLGIVIMLCLTAAAVIKADYVREMLGMLSVQLPELLSLYGAAVPAVLCMIVAMDEITAPSVSLEGKTIWILQSLPVDSAEVLKAKERLHVLINGIPALFCSVILSAVVRSGIFTGIASALFVFAFTVFTADMGLYLDLRSPNLVWTNENVPIKQNTSVLFCMLGGFAICVVYAAVCWFGTKFIAPGYIILLFAAALLVSTYFIRRRILTRGARDFERL